MLTTTEEGPELCGPGVVFHNLYLCTRVKHFTVQRAVPQQTDTAEREKSAVSLDGNYCVCYGRWNNFPF